MRAEAGQLEIRLLGPFQVTIDGKAVAERQWARRKARQLVKILALQPHHQLHREQLMEALWPEADPHAASNNLHKTIHAARRALEPSLKAGAESRFIITNGQQVSLQASAGLQIDAIEFERKATEALASGDQHQQEAAVQLYAADLLPEDLYEDWTATWREQLRSLYRDLLLKLARSYIDRGLFTEAVARLRQALAADPLNEELHRSVMRAHALSGNRHQALLQFEQCRNALKDELGAEPEQATLRLRADVESGRLAPIRSAAPAPINSVAVIPFVNEGGDPELEYLSEGLSETIINALARLGRLRVRGWSTVARFRHRPLDPVEAARQVGARAALSGRLLARGSLLRISVELLDATDGSQIWGEQYTRTLTDIISVQSEISTEISEKLLSNLTHDESVRLAKRHTENVEAYHAYLKGRHHWNKRTDEGLRKGLEYFKQAIDIDPSYAIAHCGLADSYLILGSFGLNSLSPHDSLPKAREAAKRALAIDESLAEAHASLGFCLASYYWDWNGAERAFKRAIELRPDYATAHHWYAFTYLAAQTRLDEAIAEERLAVDLEPLAVIISTNLGTLLYLAGRHDEALHQYKRALEVEPGFPIAYWMTGLAFEAKGQHRKAIEAFERAVDLSAGGALPRLLLCHSYAASGKTGEALEMLGDIMQSPDLKWISPYRIATIYAALGDRDRGFYWLERAVAERDQWLMWIRVEPSVDSLRSDERYDKIVAQVGLNTAARSSATASAEIRSVSGASSSRDQSIDSMAVLPLRNDSGDPRLEYLSDGITETLISNLCGLAKLKVMAWSTVSRYKNRDLDPASIGRELGVRALLTGRVVEFGDRIVIKTELVDALDGSQIWGEQYDREPADILAVQQAISADISEKLLKKLSKDERRRLARRATNNTDAYHAYLRGRYYWNKRTAESIKRGADSFKEAIDIDPLYAAAYAGLSDCYTLLVIRESLTPVEGYEKAKAAAQRALEIDEELGEARASLAHAMLHNWEWSDSEREFRRAIGFNSRYPSAHHWYSEHLCAMGHFDEAVRETEEARSLDPLSLIINSHLGDVLFFARRYEAAEKQLYKALELDPTFALAHEILAQVYERMGRHEEAHASLDRALELFGQTTEATWLRAFFHASSGDRGRAEQTLRTLLEGDERPSLCGVAMVQGALGQTDAAFETLERAYQERAVALFDLKVDPKYDPLRSDSRFEALLSKMGFI